MKIWKFETRMLFRCKYGSIVVQISGDRRSLVDVVVVITLQEDCRERFVDSVDERLQRCQFYMVTSSLNLLISTVDLSQPAWLPLLSYHGV